MNAIFKLLSTGKWHLDPLSILIGVFLMPVVTIATVSISRKLKAWASFLIDGCLYWVSRVVLRSLAAQLSLKRYCHLMLGFNDELFIPSRFDTKIPLDDIFITLQLEHHGSSREQYTHIDILDVGNRLRLMGDPGSGKSSFSRRVFRDQCRLGISRSRKTLFPCYVELKTIKPPLKITTELKSGDWLYKQIRERVAKTEVYKIGDCFDTYSTTNGLLIILDGLDEVSRQSYPCVIAAIDGLSNKLAGMSHENVVLLTMRTQFHQQIKEEFRDSLGHALFIKPFTPSDIYNFLSKWPFKGDRLKMMTQIYADLTDRPTLRDMCTNPLVLSMYVAEIQSTETGFAPESRTDFYQRVTEELVIKRRFRQTGKAIALTKLREQREAILGRLAFEHLLDLNQPSNSISWNDAIRSVQDVLKCSQEDAETHFQDIEKETGLVTEERQKENVRFIHLTLCEFLAAEEAIKGQEKGWDRLVAAHEKWQANENPQARSRLLEVIPFSVGLMTSARRSSAITKVSKFQDYQLLARCFLETKAYEHPAWPRFFDTIQKRILETGTDDWNVETLRDLHLLNVVARDQQLCSEHVPRLTPVDLSGFYEALASLQQSRLVAVLSLYASQDAAAAFRLAESSGVDLLEQFPVVLISNCDQAPFLELIVQRALNDPARIVDWARVLVEAALRSRAVASMLAKLPCRAELDTQVQRSHSNHNWCIGRLSSLYTQLLTLSLTKELKVEGEFKALSIFRQARPFGLQMLFSSEVRIVTLSLISIMVLFFCSVVVNDFGAAKVTQIGLPLAKHGVWSATMSPGESWVRVLRHVSLYSVTAAIYAYMFWMTSRRIFYKALLNLPLTDERLLPGVRFPSRGLSDYRSALTSSRSRLPFRWLLPKSRLKPLVALSLLRLEAE